MKLGKGLEHKSAEGVVMLSLEKRRLTQDLTALSNYLKGSCSEAGSLSSSK